MIDVKCKGYVTYPGDDVGVRVELERGQQTARGRRGRGQQQRQARARRRVRARRAAHRRAAAARRLRARHSQLPFLLLLHTLSTATITA